MTETPPRYLALYESGELIRRAEALRERARACALCPRRCGVDRSAGQTGFCRAGWNARVASHNAHTGEEPPISGTRGSGTVFFSFCTLRCIFCQNYPISQLGNGREVSDEELAGYFLALQKMQCHNLNLVTPTHYLHAIISALALAVEKGFRLPIVYNTSGYESLDTLRLLAAIVDVYLPDIKYGDPAKAKAYSSAPDYIEHNLPALREMLRQVGHLACDDDGLARHGLIVRHLVLPGAEHESIAILERLCDEVSPTTHVSLMSQYFPAHQAPHTPPLDHRIDPVAYHDLVDWIETTDLRGWVQPLLEGDEDEA